MFLCLCLTILCQCWSRTAQGESTTNAFRQRNTQILQLRRLELNFEFLYFVPRKKNRLRTEFMVLSVLVRLQRLGQAWESAWRSRDNARGWLPTRPGTPTEKAAATRWTIRVRYSRNITTGFCVNASFRTCLKINHLCDANVPPQGCYLPLSLKVDKKKPCEKIIDFTLLVQLFLGYCLPQGKTISIFSHFLAMLLPTFPPADRKPLQRKKISR